MTRATCELEQAPRPHLCAVEPRAPRRNGFYRHRRAHHATEQTQALYDWENRQSPQRDLLRIARTDAQIRTAFPSSMFPPTYTQTLAPLEDPEEDILEAMRGMTVAEILAHIQDADGSGSPVRTSSPSLAPSPLPSPTSPNGTLWPPLPLGPPPLHAQVGPLPAKSSEKHWPSL